MRKLLLASLTVVFSTIWIVNFFSGIVGGIWLLLTGGWSIVVLGLIASFLMPWAYTIASLPTLFIFLPLINKAEEKHSRFWVGILGFIVAVYEKFITSIWVITIFDTLFYVNKFSLSPIALWLWGFSIVMGPIGYMAHKEGPDAGLGTTFGVLFVQVAYFVLTINLILGGGRDAGYMWLWLTIFAFACIGIWLGVAQMSQAKTCLNCGRENYWKSIYCKFCGDKL